uniref:SET domain-containing protein n=1 Tax=Ditylenchus dipsaci TaxID=166011 RepID=A0A915D4W4_9BILA
MFVYAVKNINKGEEVTITYCDSFIPYTERAKKLQYFGFQCYCELCAFEKANPTNATKEEIWRQAEAIGNNPLNIMQPTQQVARQLEYLIQQIKGNRIHGQHTNTLQFHPLTSLYYMHKFLGNMEKCLEILNQMMACCGDPFVHIHGVDILLWMADCNFQLGNRQAARANISFATTISQYRMGGDENLFKKAFSEAQKSL